MFCLAILDSGNYAMSLCNILERKGYVFEVVSTPCHIAKNGCGYCIRFPFEYKDILLNEAAANNFAIREIYMIENQVTRNRYEQIY